MQLDCSLCIWYASVFFELQLGNLRNPDQVLESSCKIIDCIKRNSTLLQENTPASSGNARERNCKALRKVLPSHPLFFFNNLARKSLVNLPSIRYFKQHQALKLSLPCLQLLLQDGKSLKFTALGRCIGYPDELNLKISNKKNKAFGNSLPALIQHCGRF